ncbi:DUF6221 family protein [Streptomyces sp. NPDC008240]|uniref:DUF6221 family protein n=1 Tax=Streptomyces sp. NPDC008240 TaxID=3364822 RepID=UPI0036EF17AB
MPDLHGWITQQIDKTETIARDAGGKAWHWEHDYGDMCNDPTCPYGELATDDTVLMSVHGYDVTEPWQGAAHIARHDPATVLRRCAADRKILDIHKPYGGRGYGGHACTGCGEHREDWAVEHANDCPTLQALAEGYGLTPETLAILDRPIPEPYPPVRLSGPRPDTRCVPPALRGPNWPGPA